MNSSKLRDYLEIAGIFGVMISLLFVGFELRHSSKVAKIEAYEAYNSNVIEITLEMSGNPKLAGLVIRSFQDLKIEELSNEEYGILFSYFLAHVHARSGIFTAIKEGILPESFRTSIEKTRFFNNNIFRSMWPIQKREFDEEFISFFEKQSWNT